MTALEQSFAELCAKHDLTRLDVGGRAIGRFGATAWWDGYCNKGPACAHGTGDTIAEALSKCLGEVRELRLPDTMAFADEPLPEAA